MVFKATFQKESPKQSLPKVSSAAAVHRCSSKQVLLKFSNIHRKTSGVTLIKLQTSTQVFSCGYCEFFTKNVFGGICRSSLLNQKQCRMLSSEKGRSGHSTRYLHIISRNHSNTLLLINLQKPKTCPK